MGARKRILVVDDEQVCRDSIIELLEPYDYEVNAVTNGKEALESFKRNKYDLLITDVQIPGISGLGLLKAVWSTNPWTKAIIITANNKAAFFLESMVIHGLLEYQLKPIDRDKMKKTVFKILSQPFDSLAEESVDQRYADL